MAKKRKRTAKQLDTAEPKASDSELTKKPRKKKRKAPNDEIDDIFGELRKNKPKNEAEEEKRKDQSATDTKSRNAFAPRSTTPKDDIFGLRVRKAARRTTEEGYKI